MAAIVDIQIGRLQKLLADRKLTLELDDTARTWLANKGYDPTYGARPLKRVIQKAVQDPLAEQILAGKIKDGQKVNGHRARRPAGRQRPARQGRGVSRGQLACATCSVPMRPCRPRTGSECVGMRGPPSFILSEEAGALQPHPRSADTL